MVQRCSGEEIEEEGRPARVSRGSEVDTWKGLSVQNPKRNPEEQITVTCVIYNAVAGGVPSEGDVAAAINDMEALYAGCQWNGRLAEAGADFTKVELNVAGAMAIGNKLQSNSTIQAPCGLDRELGSFSDDEMAPREAAPVHRNVVCDVTEAVIAGVRFKKKGLEYDLFEAEFEKAEQLELSSSMK